MSELKYIPQPIGVDDVKLPTGLENLVELMARQVHELWAAERIKQGWTYNPKRDDTLKHHPCLIPYDDLPEDEKIYDRKTALGTLQLILKLGYNISK